MEFETEGRWYGEAVCYGPHRDGQRPGGSAPSRDQIREDLDLVARHWRSLRVYGSSGSTREILETIRERDLDLKVMLGVWISAEQIRGTDGAVAANRAEVASGIDLAAEFRDVVASICVGNETQVAWSPHRSPPDVLIRYLREVRSQVSQPVTTADDFGYWNTAQSRDVAREIDFLNCYAHPLWNGLRLERALDWVRTTLDGVRRVHPDRPIVLGETGWATEAHDEGAQGRLIRGTPGEDEQATYFDQVRAWSRDTRTPVFFFEAFDENWKGGDHPREVEKHWGVYNADRSPKMAVRDDR